MDTVQQIAFSFNYSAQKLRFFQAELDLDKEAQAGMNNIANLHMGDKMVQSCERSVYIQLSIHCCSHCPGIFGRRWDGKVRCYLSIKNVDFIITLVTIEHVLQSRLALITFLQSKQCNLCQGGNYYNRPATADSVVQLLYTSGQI